MKFGKYAVVQPVTYTFKEEPDWTWTFKPPTAKDELELQAFVTQGRTITENGRTETRPVTPMEMTFEELALTFGSTTIPEYKQENGEWVATDKPILKDNASPAAVKKVLSEMPTEMVLELWQALGEHVPNWGPITKDPKA
mgnify:CR=1 FL=1